MSLWLEDEIQGKSTSNGMGMYLVKKMCLRVHFKTLTANFIGGNETNKIKKY
jgi:hypothetical protein